MKALEFYHLTWLSAHPWRTEQWLRDRLADGFDIHHLDGSHSNNDPANLVLIDHADHLALHSGGKKWIGRMKHRIARMPVFITAKPAKPSILILDRLARQKAAENGTNALDEFRALCR